MKATIQQIRERLFGTETLSAVELKALREDKRKGVQQLLLQWQKQQDKLAEQKKKYQEMSTYENELRQQGCKWIAGVDEAGRGPLAGPVVADAVILKPDSPILGLNDSKRLTEKIRERLYEEIHEKAEAVGVGIVSAEEIDELNIYQAAKRAMIKAVQSLRKVPDYVLADAMELPIPIPQTSIIKGDARSVSIAAGSIVAKVTRDRMMREMHEKYPQYGFASHFGYGTAEHLRSLEQHGACPEHRRSFTPVRSGIEELKPEA
ncbi:MAG TPA: ribonuclease HII [Bacillales bacterium]|nr:ribonuclease HII [Bacillales bacterium]